MKRNQRGELYLASLLLPGFTIKLLDVGRDHVFIMIIARFQSDSDERKRGGDIMSDRAGGWPVPARGDVNRRLDSAGG